MNNIRMQMCSIEIVIHIHINTKTEFHKMQKQNLLKILKD